jgi:hypothetical protein
MLATNDCHPTVLERLTQRFETAALKLGQLIQEQPAVVG